MLLYKSLLRTETLSPKDPLYIVADKDTIEFGKTIFSLLNVRWIEVPKPATVKDGMLLKYMFRPKVDETVLYLDVDFLAKRKIQIALEPDTIACYPEGKPQDSNYCGDFTLPHARAGLSAGIFAFRYGPKVKALLDDIAKRTAQCEKNYYTLDQPHFNAVLQENRLYMNPALVSFNGNSNLDVASLINFAGEPGDGGFHFKKMLDFFLVF